MNVLYSLGGALVAGAMMYLMIRYTDKKRKIVLKMKGELITDPISLIVIVLGTVGIFLHIWFDYSTIAIPELIGDIAVVVGVGVLSVTDYHQKAVPNKILLAMFVVWVLTVALWTVTEFLLPSEIRIAMIPDGGHYFGVLSFVLPAGLGALLSGGIFLVCYLITKGKLGAGDVKLAFIMGLYLTTVRVMGAILYGCVLCLAVSLVLVFRKKLTMKDGVPMVPFLFVGMIAAFLIL